jgi:hypothetical protein
MRGYLITQSPLKDTVIAPDGENIEISTLLYGWLQQTVGVLVPPETCLFFAREHDGRMSRIIETYASHEAAASGHEYWVNRIKTEGVD